MVCMASGQNPRLLGLFITYSTVRAPSLIQIPLIQNLTNLNNDIHSYFDVHWLSLHSKWNLEFSLADCWSQAIWIGEGLLYNESEGLRKIL